MEGVSIATDTAFYKKCSDAEVANLIELIQLTFQTSSKWSIGKVSIKEIIPLCKYVYSERLIFAEESILNCKKNNIPLFYPYKIQFRGGKQHLIVPPIVEERDQVLYLGDGMHRIYSLLESNVSTAYVLITHECTLPLPGIPQTWEKVKKNTVQLPGHLNFDNFLQAGFTGYSKFCNSDFFWTCQEETR